MANRDKIINFTATAAERARWNEALRGKPETRSDICRKALDRYAAKVERDCKEE